MSLNLMVTSPSGAYLSGDFRLTSNVGHVDDLNTQKMVPIVRLGWSALVSFAGIGRTSIGLDVGEWLAGELGAIGLDESIVELEQRLSSADSWLCGMGSSRHHIFSVVGFEGSRPFAMVVSNFLDANGQRKPSVGSLSSNIFYPNRPQVFVRGWESAVLPSEATGLEQAIHAGNSARDIEKTLASININAAGRSSKISPECVTGHLLPDGTGEVTPHGIPDTVEYMPGFVKRGFLSQGVKGFLCRTNANGNPMPPRWVGMTWTIRNDAMLIMYVVRNVIEPRAEDMNSSQYWKIII